MDLIKNRGVALFKKADIIINGTRPWDIKVHNEKFFSRLLFNGSIALGESYVDGWWDCDAIDQFIYRILKAEMVNLETGALRGLGIPFLDKINLIGPLFINRQTQKRSAQDIKFHYNLGDDVFEATLDKKLSYSCGYWKEAINLDNAQTAKHDLICRKLALKPGMKVLEVGCGFGGFAKQAAEDYGVTVTGITTSKNHYEYAKEYCKGSDVQILLNDYRDINGKYDRIVCIEMMEHVGPKNHREFAEILFNSLKLDGLLLLQSICTSKSVSKNDPWIDKYIFPGSVPLSAQQIISATEDLFYILDWHDFTKDYHTTMLAWYENFNKNWPSLKDKYGERFYRLWKYYLLCCPGTALASTHHLWQIVLARIDSDQEYSRVA